MTNVSPGQEVKVAVQIPVQTFKLIITVIRKKTILYCVYMSSRLHKVQTVQWSFGDHFLKLSSRVSLLHTDSLLSLPSLSQILSHCMGALSSFESPPPILEVREALFPRVQGMLKNIYWKQLWLETLKDI